MAVVARSLNFGPAFRIREIDDDEPLGDCFDRIRLPESMRLSPFDGSWRCRWEKPTTPARPICGHTCRSGCSRWTKDMFPSMARLLGLMCWLKLVAA